MTLTVDDIWRALGRVMDPEIPTISLVDLGVVTDVSIDDEGAAHVTMTPTFTGCPAMDYMRDDVRRCLRDIGFERVEIVVNFDRPWTSNRVSEEGRRRLLQHGLAPPVEYEGILNLEVLNNMKCPFCGSHDTTLKSPFGPTLCRSLHYCRSCSQGFEAFKPV